MGVRLDKVEKEKVSQNEVKSQLDQLGWGDVDGRVQGWNAIGAPQKGLSSTVPAIQAHT